MKTTKPLLIILFAVVSAHAIAVSTEILGHWLIAQYAAASAWASESITRREVIEVPVERQSETTDAMIKRLAFHHKVPPLMVKAIVLHESGPQMRPDRVRHEPHLLKRFRKEAGMNDIEHQMLASSFGLMQVLFGLHREACGLKSFADLLDREKNLHCGLEVLSRCLKRQTGTQSEKWKGALGCFNGDQTGRYAEQIMSTFGELSLNG